MELSQASRKKLVGLKPQLLQVVERAAVLAGEDKNVDFEIVQGNRTQEYQNWLYQQGRTRPGKIVTWTKNSKHIGGGAIDFAALDSAGKITWDAKLYPQIASIFQKASNQLGVGITWGGQWTNKDWGHIELNPSALGKTQKASGSIVPVYETLRRGMKKDEVKQAQENLRILGYDVGPIDGVFGTRTEAAVKEFQDDQGWKGDGVIGPVTWTKLGELAVPPKPTPELRIPIMDLSVGKDYDKVVRHYEGERLVAYKVGGIWHIGIGHSASSRIAPIPYEGLVISPQEMNEVFLGDTRMREALLKRGIHVPLTQRQYDALMSLYFNRERTFAPGYEGPGDQLVEAINAEDWKRAELEMNELVNAPAADGVFYKGLSNRRRTEMDLFAGRSYELY